MEPENRDAQTYSRPGWGGALVVVGSLPSWPNWIAGRFGLEAVNLLSDTTERVDSQTLLRTEIHKDQYVSRLYLGPELGPRGRGFLQPYAGVHGALMLYTISTTLTIPNDADPENVIQQDLGGDSNLRFGYDVELGVDWNISNKVVVGGGVRYAKSFGVPQQLEETGSVTVHPDYVQAFLTLGVTFSALTSGSGGS